MYKNILYWFWRSLYKSVQFCGVHSRVHRNAFHIYLANGKGTKDRKSAQFVQPAGSIAERRTMFIVDCSTGCLRMVSNVSSLLNTLRISESLPSHLACTKRSRHLCSLHLTERSAEFKRYTPDLDCQCVTAQTQGPQGTISTVVLEDEQRILQALKEIKDFLRQHASQLLEVSKMTSLLTLICETFFSDMIAG